MYSTSLLPACRKRILMNRDDVPSENIKLKPCKENWMLCEFHSVMTAKNKKKLKREFRKLLIKDLRRDELGMARKEPDVSTGATKVPMATEVNPGVEINGNDTEKGKKEGKDGRLDDLLDQKTACQNRPADKSRPCWMTFQLRWILLQVSINPGHIFPYLDALF